MKDSVNLYLPKQIPIRIAFPAVLTIVLFITAIFFIILPALEESFLARKREMIRELTESAWSVLTTFELREKIGLMNRREAQNQAISQIRNLRYGPERKDYFWINDMVPRMVMHPYRTDLEGNDVSGFEDPQGKRLFIEFVQMVKAHGAGYVDYMWQWKDDYEKIVPKLSYVKGFEPWGWIVGTGIYIEDVNVELARIRRKLSIISAAILAIVSLLAMYIIRQTVLADRIRKRIGQERANLMTALQGSEEKYRNLVETMNEGLGIIDSDFDFTYVNRNFARMLGRSRDEIVGRQISDFVADDYRHVLNNQIAARKKGETRQYELVWSTKDKKRVTTLISPKGIFDQEGRFTGSFGVITDVSQLKQTEEALRESRRTLSTLMSNLPGMAYRCRNDENWTMEFVSDGCRKLTGYQPTDLMQNRTVSYADLIHPQSRAAVKNNVEAALKAHASFQLEYRIVTADNREKWVWEQGQGVFSVKGELLALEGFVTDITQRNLAEQALRENQAREHEISIASKIQTTLLLGQPPRDIHGIRVAHLTIASQRVDGDFYDFIKLGSQCFDLVIGDVMGKGIAAALLGAAVKSHVLRVLNEQIRISSAEDFPNPAKIITDVNAYMFNQLEAIETFVTLCYGRFDLNRSLFSFVDCGHMRTIHFQKAANTCRLLQGENMPIGFPEQEVFSQSSSAFGSGDFFVFYSDGLTESKNPDELMYGEKRLVDFVQANASMDPYELVKRISQDVVTFSQSDTFDDDFTCVLVKIDKEPANPGAVKKAELEIQSDLKQLGQVRSFLREFCQNITQYKTDEIFLNRLELAATEVTANIIEHAYGNQPGNRIQVDARLSADQIILHFHDWGIHFDPQSVPPPVFDGSRESGFGLHIITKIVDEVDYSQDDAGKNCCCLKFKLDAEEKAHEI